MKKIGLIDLVNSVLGAFVFAGMAVVLCNIMVLCGAGCLTEADGELRPNVITNAIKIVKEVVITVRDEVRKEDGKKEVSDPVAEDGAGEREAPVLHGNSATGSLVWKYGGFDGSKAVEDPNTQIKDLHMSKSGMSYKWAKGGCENFGATSKTDCDHALACAFYWDEKQWVGGKFDWISTSRTTRDFKNVHDHYKGWEPEKFFAAPKRAFCIVSAAGKKRTNLLETKEP